MNQTSPPFGWTMVSGGGGGDTTIRVWDLSPFYP